MKEKMKDDQLKIAYKCTYSGPNDYRTFEQKYNALQKMKKSKGSRPKSSRYMSPTVASTARNLCKC